MKVTFIAISAVLAGLASAQSLADLPTCASQCVGNSIPANCGLDPACICRATSFISGLSCCVSTACGAADQEATLQFARGICQPVGVTNLPTAATCTGSATASSTRTGSAASSVTSSVSGAISSISESVSSISAAATSSAGALSSAAESAAESASQASESASAAATSASNINLGDKVAVQGMSAFGAALMGLAAFL